MTGFRSFFYGNFDEDGKKWETYPAQPRYSTHYIGLRNRIGILSEAYAYASFRDRVRATVGFVRAILEEAAANRARIAELVRDADRASREIDPIPLATENVPFERPFQVAGFDGENPRAYECLYDGLARATRAVPRPFAYLLAPELGSVVENLQRHGIEVERLREDLELEVEVDLITKITCAKSAFQGHRMVSLEATRASESRPIPAGTLVVRTDQPLGTLAAILLEPGSEDGLAAWNLLDPRLQEGSVYPVVRIRESRPLLVASARPTTRGRRTIRFDDLHGEGPEIDLSGDPLSDFEWLDDERYLVDFPDHGLLEVEARSGASRVHAGRSTEALVAAAKEKFDLDAKSAWWLVESGSATHDPAGGRLLEIWGDLWTGSADGAIARLTSTPAVSEKVASFSPDDGRVTFVREGDLHVVEVATALERRLTTDGGAGVANGELDWVYMEELYGRGNTQGYWWSPDGARLAFLQIDDRPVPTFTLVDDVDPRQAIEATRYPRAGDANPIVRLGVVEIASGRLAWADLSAYSPPDTLIVHVGWLPDGSAVYFYVQNRIQTWLDFDLVSPDGGPVRRILRETTPAWVESPGEPRFLADGSFLLPSERTGWRHLYHYSPAGDLLGAVTQGEWEVRDVELVDEAGGWVYVSGTKDSPIATNLYRARLDGSDLERLTFAPGSHATTISPGGKLFVDTYSDHRTPARVDLRSVDGAFVRRIDTNPVPELASWDLGRLELVQIPIASGRVLEGSLLYPPDFDSVRRYPVWFTTYGGPHAPSTQDAWSGGRLQHRMLAAMGFVVFSCDPTSASGKGAVSTWTSYRRFGVGELRDIEEAIRWLSKNPWVDPSRIGIGGHSYGGFLAAYALTHSDLFACGVAGAPVTDWRLYDTIYTERYMDTPEANPEGYAETSVIEAAGRLHGRLLLVHGGIDDNVHLQNTLQLAHALQEHDRDFELMIYPENRHGIWGRHYQRTVVDFLRRTLRPDARE